MALSRFPESAGILSIQTEAHSDVGASRGDSPASGFLRPPAVTVWTPRARQSGRRRTRNAQEYGIHWSDARYSSRAQSPQSSRTLNCPASRKPGNRKQARSNPHQGLFSYVEDSCTVKTGIARFEGRECLSDNDVRAVCQFFSPLSSIKQAEITGDGEDQ